MPDPALAKKLNVKPGMKLQVVGKPEDVDLGDLPTATSGDAAGVLLFVRKLVDVDAMGAEFLAAAREDRLAWIAYPKAGKLGTDLNRDILWRHLTSSGVQGVRQIAIDDVWSAMRFRPAT